MIDTDKYEAPWGKWSVGHEGQHDLPEGDIPINVNGGLMAIAYSQADAQLIAAAPLLLEEVKRLREENDALLSAIDMCIVTQMNSVEHGFRYQSGGCLEHYSEWEHEKESEEE